MLTESLRGLLDAGEVRMGQILIRANSGSSGWELRHEADRNQQDEQLETHREAEAARELGLYSEDRSYRALKGGNDLRRGWRLELGSVAEVRDALDYFYPAALGMALAGERLRVVPLRETLERQTGMYRFARTISEAGVERVVGERCERLCLRRVLWAVEKGEGARERPAVEAGEIPLWCSEACNMLVADAREVAKAEFEAAAEAARNA